MLRMAASSPEKLKTSRAAPAFGTCRGGGQLDTWWQRHGQFEVSLREGLKLTAAVALYTWVAVFQCGVRGLDEEQPVCEFHLSTQRKPAE